MRDGVYCRKGSACGSRNKTSIKSLRNFYLDLEVSSLSRRGRKSEKVRHNIRSLQSFQSLKVSFPSR